MELELIVIIIFVCLASILLIFFRYGAIRKIPSKGIPSEIGIPNLRFLRFTEPSGEEIPLEKYKGCSVWGKSLEPMGIPHKSLIFIEELSYKEYSKIKFPELCVFRRYPKTGDENQATLTTGAVFGRIMDGDPKDLLEDIFKEKTYQKFRSDPRYVSDSYVRRNLKIPKNLNDISLMMKLDKDNKFKIICLNSEDIFGRIEHAFDLGE